MGVTHVLRGEEWLPSTPKHLSLYAALGFTPPQFAHMPLLVNPDGSKLSKRAGDVRVEDYVKRGYEPEALLNFVALMGWSPQSVVGQQEAESVGEVKPSGQHEGEENDVLDVEELIAQVSPPHTRRSALSDSADAVPYPPPRPQFSLAAINKNRATMSPAKLDFLNRAHLQRKLAAGADAEKRRELSERAAEVVGEQLGQVEEGTLEAGYVGRVLEALKVRQGSEVLAFRG